MLAKLILKGHDMKKTALVMTMIAGVSFGGIPIQWDVKVGYDQRFNESSPVAYNITAMRGETLDLMPRYMSSGYPFSIASNADVRIYLREYGTTNAFTVSSTSGTVYTTSSQLGRVRAVLLPSDIPATGTNQFFVGVESSGMVYRAYGKLTVLDSPGVIASTNQIQRGVFDSSMFTFSNSHLAPWSLSDIGNYCGVQSVNGLTGVVSITAESLGALTNVPPQSYTIITNAPWAYETNTVTRAGTNGWEVGSHAGLATTGALAELAQYAATSRTDTVWVSDDEWYRFSGGGTATLYRVSLSTTNGYLSYSSDFSDSLGASPALTNVFVTSNLPVGRNIPLGNDFYWERAEFYSFIINTSSFAKWQTEGLESFPTTLTVSSDGYGSAIVSAAHETNTVVYVLTTGNVWGAISDLAATNAVLAAAITNTAEIVAALAPTNAPTLLNPRVAGALNILNVMPTNLTARVFGSNDVLYVIWGNQ